MKEIDVLCVDDNEDYCYFLEKAFTSGMRKIDFHILNEGKEAVSCLQEQADNYLRPRLILLDINMPDLDGMEILKNIKASNNLRRIPVVMLTTSDSPKDITHAFNLGANAYVSKPNGFKQLKTFLQDTCNFWLDHNCTSIKPHVT